MIGIAKKCPFCGGKPTIVHEMRYPLWPTETMKQTMTHRWACFNPECPEYMGTVSMYYPTEEAALEAWNTRKG